MFETHYNEEMEAEVRRLEGKRRAMAAGHPEWDNACALCGCRLTNSDDRCGECQGISPASPSVKPTSP